ncbi:hypothetical protein [Arcticibacter eurypsychrophilus]|uniref:hypothetical protein n=1 Tax=Arcticibacter eurypsychrophilus TaxID=1434752 RepID=UPI00084DBEAC|nr:hypothetical protein [Arcticibacter eurypsychrophilus]
MMIKSREHKLNRIGHKSYKLLCVSLLILFVVFSSCAVRKGLQYLLLGDSMSNTFSGKTSKVILILSDQADNFSTTCQNLVDTKSDLFSLVLQHDSGNANFPALYFLLPAFLLPLPIVFKASSQLPVPYSLQRWPQLSLFLQNRLLLI